MTWRLVFLVFLISMIFVCVITSRGHSHNHGHIHEQPLSLTYCPDAKRSGDGHCHSDDGQRMTKALPHYDSGTDDDNIESITRFYWMKHALLSTLTISLIAMVILFLIPMTNSPQQQLMLRILLYFTGGGLLAASFLSFIRYLMNPHGLIDEHLHLHSKRPNHSTNNRVVSHVLSGILLFLAVDKLVRLMKRGHGHSHGHVPEVVEPIADDGEEKKKEKRSSKTEVASEDTMKVSGYLNLCPGGFHYFTNGLVLGLSYSIRPKLGIVTALAISSFRTPHTIEDYAILIQNDFSRKQIILRILATAVGVCLGCPVGLLFRSTATKLWTAQTFLPIAAGGLIYIIFVGIIPELLEILETNGGWKQAIISLIGLFFGVLTAVAGNCWSEE